MEKNISKNSTTSIIILTRNAGPIFHDVLTSVFDQDYSDYEVMILDSASADSTIEIARRFPVRLVNIDPGEFGHGKTRNTGARIAQGKNLVFLTQDAIPENRIWLKGLTSGLDDKKIAAVYGRQVARKDAVPMEKFFYKSMYGDKRVLWSCDNIKYNEIIFSNVSSAVRRDLLLENPFSETILMSEDMEWAYRMIEKKLNILYQPLSVVNHSHNTGPVKIFKRYFDFGVSHRQISIENKKARFLGKGLSVFINEIKYLISNKQAIWIPRAVIYYFMKFAGLISGKNHKYIPKALKRNLSNYRMYWK